MLPRATPVTSTTATVCRLRDRMNTSTKAATITQSATRDQPAVAAHMSATLTIAGAGYPHHIVQSEPVVPRAQKFVAPDMSPLTVIPRKRYPAVSAAKAWPSSCTTVTGSPNTDQVVRTTTRMMAIAATAKTCSAGNVASVSSTRNRSICPHERTDEWLKGLCRDDNTNPSTIEDRKSVV